MTAITVYTTYNDIRAALGVSDEELDDATLGLNLYSDALQSELQDIDSTLPSTFATVKALASPTDAQARFLQEARLFATYCVARQLTTSLPLFAAKSVTDSKAAMQRFDGFDKAIAAIEAQYNNARAKLATAVIDIGTTLAVVPTLTFLGVSTPSVDRITGS